MTPSILVVDDDPSIRTVLTMALEDAGFALRAASNGRAALTEHRRAAADLIVLDIGMPDMDGLETCQAIRAFSTVPILFLTARDEEIDRVLGFQLGGDDYVTKPFSPRELTLRVKAILARARAPEVPVVAHGELTLHLDRHEAQLGGAMLSLTALEFALLEALAKAGGRVLSRNALIDAVYGGNPDLSDRTIDSHVRNLRKKARDVGHDDLIRTVHGVGLRIGACAR